MPPRSIFERLNFTDRFLYRRLDCCGPTSGQPGKRHREYEKVKEVLGFAFEVTVSDDGSRDFRYRS